MKTLLHEAPWWLIGLAVIVALVFIKQILSVSLKLIGVALFVYFLLRAFDRFQSTSNFLGFLLIVAIGFGVLCLAFAIGNALIKTPVSTIKERKDTNEERRWVECASCEGKGEVYCCGREPRIARHGEQLQPCFFCHGQGYRPCLWCAGNGGKWKK